jgi:hypothetical protein
VRPIVECNRIQVDNGRTHLQDIRTQISLLMPR